MKPKQKITNQNSLFFNFEDTLNQNHPLFILANKIHWHLFEDAFLPLYSQDKGPSCEANPFNGKLVDAQTYS